MEIEQWPNLVAMFLRQAAERGERPFLWEKLDGIYRSLSWREVARRATSLAATLKKLGLKPGDRVLLLSANSPAWVVADFAVMAAGGVTVPVYTTNTPQDHAHIIKDSGAKIAIVSTAALAAKFLEGARQAKRLRRVVAGEDLSGLDTGNVAVTAWDQAIADGADGTDAIADAVEAIPRDSLACLIYTSGTGGAPKGVMLSHRAIIANCVGAHHVLIEIGLDEEVFLSFLPLSHAYEHTAGLMFPVSIGAEIYFAERIDTLTTNLPEACPTIMTAVPRLYELMRERMIKGIIRKGGLRAKLFTTAIDLGRKKYENPGTLSPWESFVDRIVERLVRDKVRARFGGRLKALVSGGAPLTYDVGVFFTALGLRLLQGYGQTEAAPVISCNRCNNVKLRTVGPPLKQVEVRIANDGEVLVRGPLLMDGYWNQPDLSAETIRDGWLHTGDIGLIDSDGALSITDRKKDIIVNSSGDTISPQRIECALGLEPEIAAAMAVGDNRPHIVAIIVPAPEFVAEWTNNDGEDTDLADLVGDRDFRKAMSDAVDRANRSLQVTERVKRFALADQPFTIENRMMTPTMKPRRHEIFKRWGQTIESLY